ncbi:NifB/NifX family molybdenum-iron cluster-binding protein [bacterium]|nr:NifB/NifX family molybdenum-iron cluster-binding protein [bacterium]
MKIAVSTVGTKKDSKLEPRFGRANYFVVYDTETKEYTFIDNQEIQETAHGAGPQTSQKIFDAGVNVILTGNGPGKNAFQVLEAGNIKMFICKEDITAEEVITKYLNNELKAFEN